MKVTIPCQKAILSRYGPDVQSMVCMEECAELAQAVSKMRRDAGKGQEAVDERYCNLVEEMADVLICMEQLRLMYSISEQELQDMIDAKAKRNMERL